MKYLLGTAVLVELLRPATKPLARDWISSHYRAGLGVSAMTLAELHGGVARMAPGPQRNLVTGWLSDIRDEFSWSILAFGEACAGPCARLQALGLSVWRPVPLADAMTIAVAETYGLILAARTSPHLTLWGGPMVDPWQG